MRPLFDVEAELRVVKWQLVQVAEQPDKRHPIVSRKISPKYRMLVAVGEATYRVADFLTRSRLRTNRFERPFARLRPIDFAAFDIEFTAVLGHPTDADQIDGVGPLDKFGIDRILHGYRQRCGRITCK